MKIIHCADVHLDSAMETNLSPEQAKERGAELLATFSRLVRYAAENEVDAVLIAGDLFDTGRVSAQTAAFVLDRIRQAKNVTFYYLRGNHDEGRNVLMGAELPKNLKTFGSAWTYYRCGGIVIAGVEPERDGWEKIYDALSLNAENTNIVMLHGQIATQPGREQIALPLLRRKHIDYLALGHIHSFHIDTLDGEGQYAYCGCLEGRGFDECGEKGFVQLDVTDGSVAAEFIPFAARTLYELPVDITGLLTVSQILAAMEKAAEGIRANSLVKFTLTGAYTLQAQKDLRFLTKMIREQFYFAKVKDESHLQIDRADYANDISLKGEFIRMVLASDLKDADKEQIICCGIQALSGEEVQI